MFTAVGFSSNCSLVIPMIWTFCEKAVAHLFASSKGGANSTLNRGKFREDRSGPFLFIFPPAVYPKVLFHMITSTAFKRVINLLGH